MIASWGQVESYAYWTTFTAAFLGVSVWESIRPRGELSVPTGLRWRNHGALLLVASLSSTVLLRSSPVLVAIAATRGKFGLPWLEHAPPFVSWVLTILLLDFVKYASHWLMHSIGILWRVHLVHHSDPDFDVSTGIRAHPIETILTQASILLAVLAFRPPAAAVLAAELLSCTQSFFQHANASLPAALESALRPWLVTPDWHRLHHSMDERDQRYNLGEIFPWWDRLFGTYSSAAMSGEEEFVTGIKGAKSRDSLRLAVMLTTPFKAPVKP